MRIALLTYSTKPRGSVVHSLELANALHHQGVAVCLLALDKDGLGFERTVDCNLTLVPAQSIRASVGEVVQQRIQDYLNFLKCDPPRFDVYHAQDCISANALILARQQGYIPAQARILRTVHHIDAFTDPYLQLCQERSIQDPDRCLVVSKHWQLELKRQYGIEAPIVPNGVDIQRFSPHLDGSETALQDRLGLHGAPLFLTVGGVAKRKNSIRLVQAFTKILQHHPQSQLVIAGGVTVFDYKAYQDEFSKVVQGLGTGSLILAGVVTDQDLPLLYRCADAFVFPSLKEGWGLVVMEAIASGLPVLTSNQVPFTEFLTSEQAVLVNPLSVEAIATGMEALLKTNSSQVEASQRILSQYSWAQSARIHIQLYRQM